MLIEPFHLLEPTALHSSAYDKGAIVFRQDEETRGLFFVQDGQINLQRITEAGHIVTIYRATPGTLFAEASLYSERYHCDALCVVPSVVIRINKQAVVLRMSEDPAFALAFNRLLARQIQTYRQTLEILAIRSAKCRTLAGVSAGYLSGPVTEFASRIGLTHEACYRALRSLCDEGVLVKSSRGMYALAS